MSTTIDGSASVTINSGAVLGITSGTAVPYTSFTTTTYNDFLNIPSWVKRITLMLNSVSTSGTSSYLIQIGDSGGIENSGYVGGSGNRGGEVNSSLGFALIYLPAAASSYSGAVTLTLQGGTTTWVASGVVCLDASGQPNQIAGSKTLSPGPLDRVRFTTISGDTFDAGSINILYE